MAICKRMSKLLSAGLAAVFVFAAGPLSASAQEDGTSQGNPDTLLSTMGTDGHVLGDAFRPDGIPVSDTARMSLSAAGAAALPSSVDLSADKYFPPIGDQGTVFSCNAWATTYYQFGYQVDRLNNWNGKASAQYQFSPMWTYNFINDGGNNPTYDADAYQILRTQGAARQSEFPTISDAANPNSYLKWDLNTADWRGALKTRVSGYNRLAFAGSTEMTPITSATDSKLTPMKTYLSTGHPLTFATDWGNWLYVKDPTYGYVYCSDLDVPGSWNGHALTIVGYNDNLKVTVSYTKDGKSGIFTLMGAFKVANQWGITDSSGFPNNGGYFWLAYDALNAASVTGDYFLNGYGTYQKQPALANYSYNEIEVANYPLTVTAEVTLSSDVRGFTHIQIGSSSPTATAPDTGAVKETALSWSLRQNGGFTYPFNWSGSKSQQMTFVFDYSVPAAQNPARGRYYLYVADNSSYAVEYKPGGNPAFMFSSDGNITNVASFKILDQNQKVLWQTSPSKALDGAESIWYLPAAFVSASSITLNKTTDTLKVTATDQLTATIAPSSATVKVTSQPVTWTTNNASIATVSSTGLVTAVAPGTATIMATAADGSGAKATCAVTVTANVTRMGGADRFATAVLISGQGWKTASTVYLAYGLDYPDALAAVSLAALNDAPILLTNTASVPDATMKEIKRLGAKNIVLLGGAGVISQAEQNTLAQTYKVTRLSGSDRYATAVAIGRQVMAKSKSATAVLATGSGYADALSISPVAGFEGYPVVFTAKDKLPDATEQFISSNGITGIIIAGGTGVVSAAVESQLQALGVTDITRLAGSNRYETSAAVANQYKSLFSENISAATGANFADALTGGVLSAKLRMPMLLVDPNSGASETETAYVKNLNAPQIYVFGGTGALSDKLVQTLYK